MKTVTESFEVAQKSADAVVRREIYYKRRYWDYVNGEFAWESSWTRLPENEVASVSPVTQQLDGEQLNEFKVSNLTITVRNFDNRWRPDNVAGVFGGDSGSPGDGYEPYWTKFKVDVGFELADGTDELLTVFTGLSTEYTIDSDGRCQITVQGLEALLINAKAEGIATEVVEENAGTGNGATTAFTTDQPGVGGVREVSINGTKQIEGSDYSVSGLNDPNTVATVTFTVAPDVGEVIRVSYFYWPQDQEIHTLVASLLTSAGVTAQDIEPVIFANSVINTVPYDAQADFDSGTKTRIETTRPSGQMRVDWSNSYFSSATNWQNSMSGWTTSNTGWSTDGTRMQVTADAGVVNTEHRLTRSTSGRKVGIWEVKITFASAMTTQQGGFQFINNYKAVYNGNGTLWLLNGGSTAGSASISAPGTSQHTLTVARYDSGKILVYFDGSLKIEVDGDTTVTSTTFKLLAGLSTGDPAVRYDDILEPGSDGSATWQSATIDAGSTPTAWSPMTVDVTQDSGTISFETRTSADGVSWDSWVAVSGGYVPQSTLRRYIQLRALYNVTTTSDGETVARSFTFSYTTSSTGVELPNFTGMNVYEAIQKLGEFCNYEFGFTSSETFFFRSKAAGSSQFSLSESTYVMKITSMTSGYGNMYSSVRVTYGDQTREISDGGESPQSPAARLGERRYEFSADSNIQIAPNVDIASGVASGLLNFLSKRRRRMRVSCKFLPQLDLSDVVTLTFNNNFPRTVWYLGDDDVYHGQEDVEHWGEDTQFAHGVEAKIIGLKYDTAQKTTELELEEIV